MVLIDFIIKFFSVISKVKFDSEINYSLLLLLTTCQPINNHYGINPQ